MTKRLFTLILLFTAAATVPAYTQQTGDITGAVYDSETNEPLVGAAVSVDGTMIGTTTDADGNFTIKNIPAGKHNITISYLGYAEARESATVGNRTVFKVDIFLHSEAIELGEVVVLARNYESEGTLLVEQKEALVVVQTVGASEMSRKGTGDAEAAVAQVSGVSKQDGAKNVFVRGLGDRYNRTLLNGFPVPSEDPEYKNIALEFFSTDIIKNIGVSKVFSAENNGDVGGAVVDINSKELNGRSVFSVSLDAGVNSRAAGAEILRPDGTDFFGKSNTQRPANSKYDFVNSLDPRKVGMAMNNGFGISGGHRFLLGEYNPISFFVVAGHSTDYSFTKEAVRKIVSNGAILQDQTGEKSTIGIGQLVLANVDFRSADKVRIAYNFMLLHSNEQYVGRYYGFRGETYQSNDEGIGMMWRQQANDNLLIVNQITGKWNISKRLQANMGVAYNNIKGSEPDRRENHFTLQNGGLYDLTGSNRQKRSFSELDGSDLNVRANIRRAIKADGDIDKSNITVGYKGRFTEDNFSAMEYSMTAYPGYFDIDKIRLDELYNEANYEAGRFDLSRSDENYYHVMRDVHSVYAEVSYQITDKFAANAGVQADIIGQSMNYYVDAHGKGSTDMSKSYILPNLNLRYDIDERNAIRMGASKSYILPQAKEIAPYIYVNVGFASEGNPNLKPSDCYNLDLKWDFYPSPAELLAVGVFAKHIENPIGRINEGGSANLLTYKNISHSATVAGIEFEMRKNIFEAENTGKLAAGINASYIFSHLELDVENTAKRNTELEGASPFILNGDVTYNLRSRGREWTLSLVTNYTSDRINTLGTRGYHDIIEKGVVVINAVSSYKLNDRWGLKLKAGNLLDPSFKLTQKLDNGKNVVLNEYKRGIDVSLGVSFNL